MATLILKGKQVHTVGELPVLGSKAPDFLLTKNDLSDVSLADFKGKVKILNIVHSLDTGTCAASARAFNKAADSIGDVVILTISRDLPFAQSRFCEAEGIKAVVMLSELRNLDFGKAYGIVLTDGVLAGFLARSVVVLDRNDRVVYTQQVHDIGQEPDYASALEAAKKAL